MPCASHNDKGTSVVQYLGLMSHSGFRFIGPLWFMTEPRSTGMCEDGNAVCGCLFSDGCERSGDDMKAQNKSQDLIS